MLLADVAARERLGTVSTEEAPLAVVNGADVSFEILEALYGAVADRARLTHGSNCGTTLSNQEAWLGNRGLHSALVFL